jgi:hypothetical protein
MKYIFMTGAPGSKWSSVSKSIYFSPDIDRSDYSDERTYYHDASGEMHLMHLGAYFDPGMEFGGFFEHIKSYSKEDCEREFDRPFSGEGVRIIKSHVLSHNVGFLKQHWPECPVVLVHRNNDECLGWWVKCGHFNITYPKYNEYYVDLKVMADRIAQQNKDIEQSIVQYNTREKSASSNRQLCHLLGINTPPDEYWKNFVASNIGVTVV